MAAALSNMIPDRLSQRFELAHHPPTSKIAPVGPVRILIDGFSTGMHAEKSLKPRPTRPRRRTGSLTNV